MDESVPAGTPSQPRYEFRFTATFLRAAKHFQDGDGFAAPFRKALEEIVADPYRARRSEKLRYDWAGFRSARYEGPDRIIFRVCEECVRSGDTERSPLPCCADGVPALMISFVHFGDYHRGSRKIVPPKSFEFRDPA